MRVISWIVSSVLVLVGAVTVSAIPASAAGEEVGQAEAQGISSFADVPDSHVFVEDIEFLLNSGISTGYLADGVRTFRPGQPVLREQMAAFLYRLDGLYFGDEPPVDLSGGSPFTDVDPSHTFYREIVWLSQTGITTGYQNTSGTVRFEPSAPVLREQMAAFLCRFDTGTDCRDLSQDYEVEPFQVFIDVAPGHTFFDAIFFMAALGISEGYEEAYGFRSYRGSQPVLREQMAAFLSRYVELWPEVEAAQGPSPEALVHSGASAP